MQEHNRNAAETDAELELRAPRGWYSRGYLPHRDHPGLLQTISYRLSDSLPSDVLEKMEQELSLLRQDIRDIERQKRIELWLDAGHGSCILQQPPAAECVIEGWRHFSEKRYDLIAWVVMPNHVHVLIRVYDGSSLPKIVQSWKSYTSRRIAPVAGDVFHEQSVWMPDYLDRFIRDEKHFASAIKYIHDNPVNAGLVKRAIDWRWSSASEHALRM